MAERARGRCPGCGRVVAGRAYGIQRRAADRQRVILAPHTRQPNGRGGTCLPRGGWLIVPRTPSAGLEAVRP